MGMQRSTTSQAGNITCIRADLWQLISPDLNLVYYKIWGVIQQRVFKS